MNSTLYALPGFLGTQNDWRELDEKIISIDPYAIKPPSAQCGLVEWAHAFNEKIRPKENSWLMGYSLGGRLALHALLNDSERWKGAIIVSAHPGMDHQEARKKREMHDEKWAQRFEKEPWERLIKAWDDQDVFKHDLSLQRRESDYSRSLLADTLRYWSVSKQVSLIEQIARIPIPILWIVGEKDSACRALAGQLTFSHLKSEVWVAPEVGHRVPWANKNLFKQKLRKWTWTIMDSNGP